MGYRVTAALVTARVENGRVAYLYRGDIVPDGIEKESLENLQQLGFVEDEKSDDEGQDSGDDSGDKPKPARRSSSK